MCLLTRVLKCFHLLLVPVVARRSWVVMGASPAGFAWVSLAPIPLISGSPRDSDVGPVSAQTFAHETPGLVQQKGLPLLACYLPAALLPRYNYMLCSV